MSVMTAPAGSTEATPTEVVLEKSRNAALRAYDWVKDKVTRGWRGFLNGLRWVKDKVVQAARWTKEKVVAAARWIKDHTKSAATWIKEAAIGAWEFTAPARHWVATPFRVALTTTGGLAALLLLGGKLVVGVTVIWITYLLVTGRLRMAEKMIKLPVDADGRTDAQRRSDAGTDGSLDRAEEPGRRDARDAADRIEWRSAITARQFLVAARQERRTTSVADLAKQFQDAMSKVFASPKEAAKVWDWRAVRKAMQAEQTVVNERLQAATPKLEPVLAK